jgi:hypothetical protein
VVTSSAAMMRSKYAQKIHVQPAGNRRLNDAALTGF